MDTRSTAICYLASPITVDSVDELSNKAGVSADGTRAEEFVVYWSDHPVLTKAEADHCNVCR